MRFALVGCGNVSTYYMSTLHLHPELELVGAMDIIDERATNFSNYYNTKKFNSLEEILRDPDVEMVVNLTNPRSHFEVSRASLEAGKHVYCEKPLAMSIQEAEELVNIARDNEVHISCAPSRILANTVQTIWKALREDLIGKVHLVYAEMDGGLLHRLPYEEWHNELGVPWPYKDEMETGCTIEHAGYHVTWMVAIFGPVETVTAISSLQIPDKLTGETLEPNPPDFTVAAIKFRSGVLARLTCSWIADGDHSLKIYGDKGVLCTDNIWRPGSPVYTKRNISFLGKTIKSGKKKYPMVGPPAKPLSVRLRRLTVGPPGSFIRSKLRHLRKRVDFCLGIAELAEAIREGRPSRISEEYCLHTTEVVLAIHNALETGSVYKVKTSFDPLDPMPWAR
jgi:predicted dehydrogenase